MRASLRQFIAGFGPTRQPWATRQSYRYELINALTYPVAMAMIESSVVAVLADKAFGLEPRESTLDAFLFAMIMAAPMFANITSFAWAWLARGRPKVRFINGLQVATLLLVASIAVLPVEPPGAALLTLQIVLARCLTSGVVTLRSTVWRMNYPRHVRAQITGKFTLLFSLIGAVGPLAGYALVDMNQDAFRVVYPVCCLVAGLGVLNFSRIRLRRERELLAYELRPRARPQPHGTPSPIYEYGVPGSPSASDQTRENFWTVLRRDRTYRSYMLWQFVAGAANMMGEVVIVAVIAGLTDPLEYEYLAAISLTTAVPMLFAVLTLPYWARYLDRVHIAEFRSVQGWWWVGNQALQWAALWMIAELGWLWLGIAATAAARVVQGITRGAGMLAWNLGHNDFADRNMVATYMGIHVTLTGVRGAVAPFLAMALYTGWDAATIGGVTVLPAFGGIDYHVFLLTTALALIGERGFSALAKDIQRSKGAAAPAD